MDKAFPSSMNVQCLFCCTAAALLKFEAFQFLRHLTGFVTIKYLLEPKGGGGGRRLGSFTVNPLWEQETAFRT
jgi:hypothetical protein